MGRLGLLSCRVLAQERYRACWRNWRAPQGSAEAHSTFSLCIQVVDTRVWFAKPKGHFIIQRGTSVLPRNPSLGIHIRSGALPLGIGAILFVHVFPGRERP